MLFQPINNADFVVPVEIDGAVHQVYVLKRPHVDEFLRRCGELYECVLFTASLAKYADPVADLLDRWEIPLEYICFLLQKPFTLTIRSFTVLALARHIGIEFVSRLFFYLLGCCPWDELRWWIFVFCHHIFSAIASQKRVRVRYCHKFVILKKLESFQFSIPRRPGRNLKLCGFVRRVKKLQNSGGNFGMGQLNSLLQASANGGRKLSYVRQRLVHQPRNKCLAFVLPIILNTWVIKDHCAYII